MTLWRTQNTKRCITNPSKLIAWKNGTLNKGIGSTNRKQLIYSIQFNTFQSKYKAWLFQYRHIEIIQLFDIKTWKLWQPKNIQLTSKSFQEVHLYKVVTWPFPEVRHGSIWINRYYIVLNAFSHLPHNNRAESYKAWILA